MYKNIYEFDQAGRNSSPMSCSGLRQANDDEGFSRCRTRLESITLLIIFNAQQRRFVRFEGPRVPAQITDTGDLKAVFHS